MTLNLSRGSNGQVDKKEIDEKNARKYCEINYISIKRTIK